MKKSELIAKLQKEVTALGDDYIKEYRIIDSGGGNAYFMISRTRRGANGHGLKMTKAEFRDYVLDQRTAKVDDKNRYVILKFVGNSTLELVHRDLTKPQAVRFLHKVSSNNYLMEDQWAWDKRRK